MVVLEQPAWSISLMETRVRFNSRNHSFTSKTGFIIFKSMFFKPSRLYIYSNNNKMTGLYFILKSPREKLINQRKKYKEKPKCKDSAQIPDLQVTTVK